MSIFNWLLRKTSPSADASKNASDFDPAHATASWHADKRQPSHEAASPERSAHRTGERLDRRERLYSVVRDAMTRAGILTASYKFKVLSIDTQGFNYLIMIDMAQSSSGSNSRLAEIEGVIAQLAKARYELEVTAVYWRIEEPVTSGLSAPQPAATTRDARVAARQALDHAMPDHVAGASPDITPAHGFADTQIVQPGLTSSATREGGKR